MMLVIREEIEAVHTGEAPAEDNVLKNAPHPDYVIVSDEWNHSYGREKAAFPLPWVKENKFWISVARVDNGWGDRNLICACQD
jgi:glycine dehydrogenase